MMRRAQLQHQNPSGKSNKNCTNLLGELGLRPSQKLGDANGELAKQRIADNVKIPTVAASTNT